MLADLRHCWIGEIDPGSLDLRPDSQSLSGIVFSLPALGGFHVEPSLRNQPPQPAIQNDPPDEQEPEQADQQAEHPPDSRHQRSENRDPEDNPPHRHTFPIGVVQVVDPFARGHGLLGSGNRNDSGSSIRACFSHSPQWVAGSPHSEHWGPTVIVRDDLSTHTSSMTSVGSSSSSKYSRSVTQPNSSFTMLASAIL